MTNYIQHEFCFSKIGWHVAKGSTSFGTFLKTREKALEFSYVAFIFTKLARAKTAQEKEMLVHQSLWWWNLTVQFDTMVAGSEYLD